MDRIRAYYDHIKPEMEAEEILQYVKQNSKRKSRKKSVLRTCMGFSVAVVVFCVAIISAGAAGVLNFNEIFGTCFQTSEEGLENELLGMTTEVKEIVPNEEYAVVLNGVSGSDKSVIFNFEVIRKDGTPVNEYFTDEAEKVFSLWECTMENGEIKQEFSHVYQDMYINEEGNISVFVKCDQTDSYTSLAGKKIVFKGGSFFDFDDYSAYCKKNGVPLGRCVNEEEIGETILSLDEWEVEFVYQPSEKALMTVSCENVNFEVPFYAEIVEFKMDGETISHEEPYCMEFMIMDMELSCTGGVFNIQYRSEKPGYSEYTWNMSPKNDVYIITAEGEKIPLYVEAGVYDFPDNAQQITESVIIEYRSNENEDIPVALDVEMISAVSFNGVVYSLEK